MGIRLIRKQDLLFGAVLAVLLGLAWSVWTGWSAYELSLRLEERILVSGTVYMSEEATALLDSCPRGIWIRGSLWPGIGEFDPSMGGARYETSVPAEGLSAESRGGGWRTCPVRPARDNAVSVDVPRGWRVMPPEHVIEGPTLDADFTVEKRDD